MSIDVIGNFLTLIRNGFRVQKRSVTTSFSKEKFEIVKVLKEEGYIKDYQKVEENGVLTLNVMLKYLNGESAMHEIKRISKPGRRCYEGVNAIEPVIGGLGISIISTNKGVLSDKKARELSVGGEVICNVW